jgi:hypothetical protein
MIASWSSFAFLPEKYILVSDWEKKIWFDFLSNINPNFKFFTNILHYLWLLLSLKLQILYITGPAILWFENCTTNNRNFAFNYFCIFYSK